MLCTTALHATAHAQVKPRFALAFDTSGSMNWDFTDTATYGDGVGRPAVMGDNPALVSNGVFYGCGTSAGIDRDCNGLPDDSKLAVAKSAVRDIISAFGDVEWSLSRFHMTQAANTTCTTYNGSNSCTVQVNGNPQCNTGTVDNVGCVGSVPAACQPGMGANASMKLSTGADFKGCINYAGTCTGGDVLVGFPDMGPFLGLGNEYAIYKWVDNVETNFVNTTTVANFCDHVGTGDCELRANGSTPLGGLLTDVSNYVLPIKTADSAASCRGYYVILLTDGAETCGGAPNTVAANLLTAGVKTYVIGLTSVAADQTSLSQIAVAGGTTRAYFPTNKTQLSAALSAIIAASIKVEVCNGVDDNCNGQIDEGFTKYCNKPSNINTLSLCMEPNETVCDGLDDDCDGLIDEGLLNTCGLCPGTREICNGIDDDCNGKIDDVGGVVGAICNCFAEICDNKDNDCNGLIDDGITRNCGSNIGICKYGTQTCAAGNFGTCVGGTNAGTETCNGLDDDCDGKVDESLTQPCGSSAVGACQKGTQFCVGGTWQESSPGVAVCNGNIEPTTETCNGKDDNCNGTVDEANPGGGVCGSAVGICKQGTLTCSAGALTCVGGTGPATETCNNKDDDCDGTIDNGNPGGGAICGSNVGQCKQGTQLCVAGAYVCQGSTAATAEICDGLDNDCNGTIDDNNPGGGGVCGSSVGTCHQGTRQCVSGALSCVGSTGPTAETCDGLDNDCDGTVDNGNPGGGAVCGSNVGACKQGTQLCVNGAYVCQGSIPPSAELCNNIDDNCDGTIDNGNPEGGGVCGSNTGTCKTGLVQCQAGALNCVGSIDPVAETCNNKDDNCNGIIDDGNPGGGASCGSSVGECKAGTQLCVFGAFVCQGQIAATPEICDGKDNNCNGSVDENNPGGGGQCGTDTGECVAGALQCQSGSLNCVGAVNAIAESCNGKDDDCDGVIDNGNPGGGAICGSSVGACKQGTQLCVNGGFVCQGQTPPTGELCNGIDDDCNGVVDNGNPGGGGLCGTDTGECKAGALTCQAGMLNCVGAIASIPEICDGKDNDCNGIIDDGNPGGGMVCGSSVGECKTGATLCVNGAFVCSGATAATTEICDGIDNDCDGVIDNGNPGGGGACGSSTGACKVGMLTCQSGALSCVGGKGPSTEICDGIDNDCDGVIDNGNPGGGQACGTNTGLCTKGTTVCVNGAFLCSGGQQPVPEVCDNKDNDCDGEIDNGNPGGGGACGTDTGECVVGTVSCQSGVLSCQGGVGPTTEICDGKDNDCDGVIDNGNPGGGGTCGTNVGVCKTGMKLCVNGAFQCSGATSPSPELCNGLDDNCNGQVDENNPQGGAACGSSIGACKKGALTCSNGAISCAGGVNPTVEVCNGIDDDCNGRTDDGNPGGGGTCGQSGPGECKQGIQLCLHGAFVCQGGVTPQNEVCDNKDNDCDGTTDEGNPGAGQVCGNGIGVCMKGMTQCSAGVISCQNSITPGVESCNLLDDDCDGKTDEGNPGGGGQCGNVGSCLTGPNHDQACGICKLGALACQNGGLACVGNITPTAERCDGLDNDCDGTIDEDVNGAGGDPNLNKPCSVTMGECKSGTTTCTGGMVVCMGGVGAMPEICDGKDNDCNGIIDDGFPVGGPCGADVGECHVGTYACDVNNGTLVCAGDKGPTAEVCDGLDNDCDGVVDNGLALGEPCGSTVGECSRGMKACSQGAVVCVGGVTPGQEVCDCKDNDCDGKIDEGEAGAGLCGAGSCVQCQCALACNDRDEFGIMCPTGKAAVTSGGKCFCVGELCKPSECGTETLPKKGTPQCAPDMPGVVGNCVCKNNVCTSPCDGVMCPPNTVCDPTSGSCQRETCLLPQFACKSNEVCDPTGGACSVDACATTTCKAGEACRDGNCFASCANVQCKSGELCVEGKCEANKCASTPTCDIGQICNPADGKCITPADCQSSGCTQGFICNRATGCEADPCLRTTCPTDQTCIAGECTSRCTGGLVECKSTCVDPKTDPTFCGAKNDCTGADVGTQCDGSKVCSVGKCSASCAAGLVQCGKSCVDAKSDEMHCGASGDCSGKRAGSVCGTGFMCSAGICRPIPSGVGNNGGTGSGNGTGPGATGSNQVDNHKRVLVTGGGGCACTVPAGHGTGSDQPVRGPIAFALGVLLLALRRLRRRGRIAMRGAQLVRALLTVVGVGLFAMLGGCKVQPFCLDCVEDAGSTITNESEGGSANLGDAGASNVGDGGGTNTGKNDGGAGAGGAGGGCLAQELCNGKDDDCDGKIDEGIDTKSDPNNCGGCGKACRPDHAFGQCKAGVCGFTTCDIGFVNLDKKALNGCEYACQAHPDPDDSVCDNRDNDCDGKIDEDVNKQTDPLNCGVCGKSCRYANAVAGASCVGGQCALDPSKCDPGFYDIDHNPATGCEYQCTPAADPTELCNRIDEDCDGKIDETVASIACGDDTGECSSGTTVCTNGQTVCMGGVGPATEICDGLDNDCDMKVDETDPRIGPCGSTLGTCQAGTFACVSGALACLNATDPVAEVCDGLDNDCDGVIDNGNPGGGVSCGSSSTGECKLGLSVCMAGALRCANEVGPTDEVCDGKDNDCDGVVDNGNPQGGAACGNSLGECANGTFLCQNGSLVCNGGTLPTPEICDGLDNNCDGLFDENNPGGGGACGSSVGQCKPGVQQCVAGGLVCAGSVAGVPEVCDGLDNDCDGVVDNGNPGGGGGCGSSIGECQPGTVMCVTGALVCTGAVSGTPEICDGLDNNCDGRFDEGNPGGGATCGSSVGACKTGVEACVGGSVVCQGAVNGSAEVCDGLDNDCDGVVDNGNPGGGATCGSGIGVCRTGTMLCQSGALSCVGGVSGSGEVCDGKDNDCDGVIDNGNPGGGATCGSAVGECKKGTQQCIAGGIVCSGATAPAAEVCDGKDNDCDGLVDNGNPGGGASCGSSVGECKKGTIQCQSGALSCVGAVSGTAEVCDGKDNNCNGLFDEGNPGGGATCGSSVGQCKTGTLTCAGGTFVCQGSVSPGNEVCDGKDNNCDGVVDENNPGGGASCGSNLGQCTAGTIQCASGALSCTGSVAGSVEVCDGLDNDCDGKFDEGNPGGGATCGSSVGACKTGAIACVSGALVCSGAVTASPEVCDGIDNNCNGTVDEGNPGGGSTCGTDTGECSTGTVQCQSGALACVGAVGGTTEVCDTKDNDCDGKFDESNPGGGATCGSSVGTCKTGVLTCTGGSMLCAGEVQPITETCDGKDNNCDGTVDEGNPGAGGVCGTDVGECSTGTKQCVSGALVCMGGKTPTPEICDGKDNNCDGNFDEGNPGGGATCGSSVGACHTGTLTCTSGALNCAGSQAAVAETCDGIDNNCNGTVDEGNPGGGGACGSDVGTCKLGTLTCGAGSLSCVGNTAPATEVCDGKDNDCDGLFDEGNPGGGAVCGSNVGTCVQGAMTCVSGGLTCVGSTGPSVEVCDTKDNNCNGSADETFNLQNGDTNNCGSCNHVCNLPNATPKCASGVCKILACNTGFVDANHTDADGCELTCTVSGPEVCDGLDNDCNGLIDDSPQLPPSSFCGINIGECKSGTVVCLSGGIQCQGTVAAVPETCDGKDNDCNGKIDENWSIGNSCSVGVGGCKNTGFLQCSGASASQCCTAKSPTACTVLAAKPTANEACNNIDDDCDGKTDEVSGVSGDNGGIGPDDFSTVTITGGVKVFQYEASRPDAQANASGSGNKLACSNGNKIPWTDVTWNEAHDACCALNAGGQCAGNGGWRLCDSPTWQTACQSTTALCKWGYGTNCSTANGATSAAQECNGKEYDSDPNTTGDQDARLATGSFGQCKSPWGAAGDIYDMSGNVKEWTNTQQSNGLFELRGGSYNNIESGRTCAFNYVVGDQAFAFQNTGFRCCNYPAAVQTCASFTATNVPQSTPGNADSGTAVSTLSVAAGTKITDVNVIGATGTTNRILQDQITLTSPGGTTSTLLAAGSCSNGINHNWSFSLDDQAAAGAASCTTPIGGGATVQPTNASFNGAALSVFNGQNSTGTWTMKVIDNVALPSCTTFTSNDVPKTIPGSPTPVTGTATSTLSIPVTQGGIITDVNVLSAVGTTGRFSQTQITLTSPAGTARTMVPSGQCGNAIANWSFNWDDAAGSATVSCAATPAGGGATIRPNQTLAVFNGQESSGTWTLKAIDGNATGAFFPTITGWSIQVCISPVYPTITAWGLQICGTD